jgi:hypothetical protein
VPSKKHKAEGALGKEERNKIKRRDGNQRRSTGLLRSLDNIMVHRPVPLKKAGLIGPREGGAANNEDEDLDDAGNGNPSKDDPFSKRSVTLANRVKKHGEKPVRRLATEDGMFVKRWVSLKCPAA